MTAQIPAYGRLLADPQTRTTGKGTNMAMARQPVALPYNAEGNGEATFWLGVIAFGKQADTLAKHSKGDLASVAGIMTRILEVSGMWRRQQMFLFEMSYYHCRKDLKN
ncbi:TPA: single-stranded DNA-binding protein [Klebsiella aerogenes]|nr:single-stranded DNA-binding protein [Klebsiella aerogenes]